MKITPNRFIDHLLTLSLSQRGLWWLTQIVSLTKMRLNFEYYGQTLSFYLWNSTPPSDTWYSQRWAVARGLGQGPGLRAKGQSGPGEKSAGQSWYLIPAGQQTPTSRDKIPGPGIADKKWYWYFCYTVESEFIIKCVGCLFWKEHLGHEYWVETECRDPVLSHNLKILERKNNFKLSQDLADFYRDCNGASLKWGHENDSKMALGPFSLIKIENITEIDDGLFSLSNCSCCPPTAFDERYFYFIKLIFQFLTSGLQAAFIWIQSLIFNDFWLMKSS